MARAGRPRKIGHRYPSGKLKKAETSVYWQRQIDAINILARDPRIESPIGIMLLKKEITSSQMDAATKFATARIAADAALGLPPRSPQAQDVARVHGLSGANDDDEQARIKKRLVAAYDRAELAVGHGSKELAALQRIVLNGHLRDGHEEFLALISGLNKLVAHYGIKG